MASSRSQQDTDHSTHHQNQDDQPQTKQSKAKSRSLVNEQHMANPDRFCQSCTTPAPSSPPLIESSNVPTRRKLLPWQTALDNLDSRLSYVHDFDTGESAIHFWITDDAVSDSSVVLASATALAVIDTFNIRAACMHLIYAAYATRFKNPWKHEIIINDKQLEKHLGLYKRTDLNQQQKLKLIKDLVEQPCKIATFINWKKTPQRKKFTVAEGRLWHLVETRHHYQQDLLTETKSLVGMTFIIRPGSWAKHFLSHSKSSDLDDSQQYSNPSKSFLEGVMSIWRHREGAARLMIWLLFNLQENKFYSYDVKTLLEIAYRIENLNQVIIDHKAHSKMADTWDEDLHILKKQGWSIHFDDETYPVNIRPRSMGRETLVRPKGFFEQLLTAKVWIGPPEDWFSWPSSSQVDFDLQFDEHSLVDVVSMTSSDVRKQRQQRGWSQRKLAALTGLSQALISLIEKDERPITVETETVLRWAFEFM